MVKKLIWTAIGFVILALAFGMFSVLFMGPSDQEMIAETITEATDAAREGRPSPVLDSLSKDFDYGGELASRFDVSKVVKESKPDLTVLDVNPTITGDTATVVSDVRVNAQIYGFAIDQTIPSVRISLERETGTKWLVIPAPKWRITKVEAEGLPRY